MKVKFTAELLSELNQFLIDGSTLERICYVFGYAYTDRHGELIVLPKKILIPDTVAVSATAVSVRLDKSVLGSIYRLFGESDYNVIINCHSHPFDRSSSVRFSGVDDANDQQERQFLYDEIIKVKRHNKQDERFYYLSYLRGQDSIAMRQTFADHFNYAIDIVEVGRKLLQHPNSHYHRWQPLKSVTRFARQILAFGKQSQEQLNQLRVCIIGAGGTGSVLAEGLIRLGVRHIHLIDHDRVEESNLNRLQGFTAKYVNHYKVTMLARKLRSYAEDAQITVSKYPVSHSKVLPLLTDTDVMFCCVDNAQARYYLNKVAVTYLIPLFDVGVALSSASDEQVQAKWRYTAVIPNITPCFDCSAIRIYDKNAVERQLFDRGNYTNLVERGYITDMPDETSPSVYHLNQHAVSKMLFEFHNYVSDFKPFIWHTYGDMAEVKTPLEYACTELSEYNLDEKSAHCFTCNALLATGDKFPMSRYASHDLDQGRK